MLMLVTKRIQRGASFERQGVKYLIEFIWLPGGASRDGYIDQISSRKKSIDLPASLRLVTSTPAKGTKSLNSLTTVFFLVFPQFSYHL